MRLQNPSQHVRDIDETLNSSAGPALMRMMHDMSLMGAAVPAPPEVVSAAQRLGWIDARRHFTPAGWLAADPLREYVRWEERGRVITYNDRSAMLGPELYADKRVVELGSGYGSNLMTMERRAASVIGVELEPYYLNFTSTLARMAGVPVPRVVLANATAVPLADRSVDLVIVLGALQVMPIRQVFNEAARLLVPDGLAVFVNSGLLGHLRDAIHHLPRWALRPKSLAREGLNLTNMMLYPLLGRRVTRPGDPVYLPRRTMSSWLEQAGFRFDTERTHEFGIETCWVAVRR